MPAGDVVESSSRGKADQGGASDGPPHHQCECDAKGSQPLAAYRCWRGSSFTYRGNEDSETGPHHNGGEDCNPSTEAEHRCILSYCIHQVSGSGLCLMPGRDVRVLSRWRKASE